MRHLKEKIETNIVGHMDENFFYVLYIGSSPPLMVVCFEGKTVGLRSHARSDELHKAYGEGNRRIAVTEGYSEK